MTHFMKLQPEPFERINSGRKTIELRLYDEKRRRIQAGDVIVFTRTDSGEKLYVKVIALHIYRSFAELYGALPLEKCGYGAQNISTASPEDMRAYYTACDEETYGVVGIEFSLIK